MAFDLRRLTNGGFTGRGMQFWTYKTDDPLSTVLGSNYFLAAWPKLRIGDKIVVCSVNSIDSTSESFQGGVALSVGAVSITGVTVYEAELGGASLGSIIPAAAFNPLLFNSFYDNFTSKMNVSASTLAALTSIASTQWQYYVITTAHTLATGSTMGGANQNASGLTISGGGNTGDACFLFADTGGAINQFMLRANRRAYVAGSFCYLNNLRQLGSGMLDSSSTSLTNLYATNYGKAGMLCLQKGSDTIQPILRTGSGATTGVTLNSVGVAINQTIDFELAFDGIATFSGQYRVRAIDTSFNTPVSWASFGTATLTAPMIAALGTTDMSMAPALWSHTATASGTSTKHDYLFCAIER